jgi:hypothetical protein
VVSKWLLSTVIIIPPKTRLKSPQRRNATYSFVSKTVPK